MHLQKKDASIKPRVKQHCLYKIKFKTNCYKINLKCTLETDKIIVLFEWAILSASLLTLTKSSLSFGVMAWLGSGVGSLRTPTNTSFRRPLFWDTSW